MGDYPHTSRADFPDELPLVSTRYCFACHAENPQPRWREGRQWHACGVCGSEQERFLTWDPKLCQEFDDQDRLVHSGAGMFVMNERGEILLFKRRKFPFLWTIPGGHLEIGEDPRACAVREVAEEVGITIVAPELIFEGVLDYDSCPGGADIHHWCLYKALVTNDVIVRIQEDEGEPIWQWRALPDIALDEVTDPVRFFLTMSLGSATIFL